MFIYTIDIDKRIHYGIWHAQRREIALQQLKNQEFSLTYQVISINLEKTIPLNQLTKKHLLFYGLNIN